MGRSLQKKAITKKIQLPEKQKKTRYQALSSFEPNAGGKDMWNSILFDVHLESAHSELNEIVLSLRSEIDPEEKNDKAKLRKVLRKIVVNLFIANQSGDAWVALSMDSSKYGPNERLGEIHMSYTLAKFCCSRLKQLGFTEEILGAHNPEFPELSHVYRMKASQNLKFKFYGIPASCVYLENDHETIVLHDVNKKNMPYNNNRFTIAERKKMKQINNLLEKTKIELPISDDALNEINVKKVLAGDERVFLHQKYLVRIFNRGKWNLGGRLYGPWWQNIPKQLRHLITIDGEGTIELDYDNHHAQMLYIQETGALFEGDIYTFKGYEGRKIMRDIFKFAILVLINAKAEDNSEWEINKFISKMYKEVPEQMAPYKGLDAAYVLDLLYREHAAISEHFGSDAGVRLMFKDSQITMKILLKLAKEGIVALPVHDSYIVQARHEDRLRAVMREEYYKVMGAYPGISRKEKPGVVKVPSEESQAQVRS